MSTGEVMERLQKAIANAGYTSRRKAEELIAKGHVTVNGEKITQMGFLVSGSDIIMIDGHELMKDINKVYYVLNKPRGIISSSHDEKGRKTVVDLIDTKERIYPIGRLDYDTTGIILLTNDGDFANLLMHPNNEITKTYLAKIDGILDNIAISKLKSGVTIDNRKVDIIDFKIRKKDIVKNTSLIEITIIEGRNHIVKRIFKELGYTVKKLTRIKYGFLTIEDLQPGEYRQLSIKEVKKFYGQKNSI